MEVLDHDFPLEELGRATPFGVYDVFRNRGFVNVGLSCETVVFAVESVRRWWYAGGVLDYGGAGEVVLTCDCVEGIMVIVVVCGSLSFKNLLMRLVEILWFCIIRRIRLSGIMLSIVCFRLLVRIDRVYRS